MMKLKIVVCLLILLLAIPTAMAQGGKVITEEGEYSFKEYFAEYSLAMTTLMEAVTVVCLGTGVALRTLYPYGKRKNEGKIDSFDDRYLGSAIGTFFLTYLAWIKFYGAITGVIGGDLSIISYGVLATGFAYLGNELFNKAIRPKG